MTSAWPVLAFRTSMLVSNCAVADSRLGPKYGLDISCYETGTSTGNNSSFHDSYADHITLVVVSARSGLFHSHHDRLPFLAPGCDTPTHTHRTRVLDPRRRLWGTFMHAEAMAAFLRQHPPGNEARELYPVEFVWL